jgi:thiol:disulfide interchange protein
MKEFINNIDWINTIKYIVGFVALGLGVYLGRFTLPFLKWMKGGIENGDGKLQNQELQIMIFTSYFGFMILATTFFGKEYSTEMVLGALAGAGIMYGANQLAKKNGNSNTKNPEE